MNLSIVHLLIITATAWQQPQTAQIRDSAPKIAAISIIKGCMQTLFITNPIAFTSCIIPLNMVVQFHISRIQLATGHMLIIHWYAVWPLLLAVPGGVCVLIMILLVAEGQELLDSAQGDNAKLVFLWNLHYWHLETPFSMTSALSRVS